MNIFFKRFASILVHFLLLAFQVKATLLSAQDKPREVINFDMDWQFILNPDENLVKTKPDGLAWRNVNLPHDWSIEGSHKAEYDDWQTGNLPGGIGFYKKTFSIKKAWLKKGVSIYFEGIYKNSEVWINGNYLGIRPNGDISFSYALNQYLKEGDNVVTVKVDHSKIKSSRWYAGSGIYRHVWLKITNPVSITDKDVQVTTDVLDGKAKVTINANIENKATPKLPVKLQIDVLNANGTVVKTLSKNLILDKGINAQNQIFDIENPQLWGIKTPNLYKIKFSLSQKDKIIDAYELSFGIRKTEFSSVWGFKLNGENLSTTMQVYLAQPYPIKCC
jgi:beta-galactosidase